MARSGYPAEFRRKVLDLIESGRSIADVAHDLEISEQTIYTWRRQDRIDRRVVPGLTSAEKAELTAAKKRTADLEAEPAVSWRAVEMLKEETSQKAVRGGGSDGSRASASPARLPRARNLRVWLLRPQEPGSPDRSIRHAWLTDLIRQIHIDSRGTYGSLRVHAELRLGHGSAVGHGAVEMLMHRAGVAGATGQPKWKRSKPDSIAADQVERQFARSAPNQLWVTDVTDHPTREG